MKMRLSQTIWVIFMQKLKCKIVLKWPAMIGIEGRENGNFMTDPLLQRTLKADINIWTPMFESIHEIFP